MHQDDTEGEIANALSMDNERLMARYRQMDRRMNQTHIKMKEAL